MVAPVLRRSRRRESGRLGAPAAAPPGGGRAGARAAHPMAPAWQIQATSDPGKAGQRWARYPEANVILPTGRVFDVLDVPAGAGLAALEMMHDAGVATGPVAVGSGRVMFFVA